MGGLSAAGSGQTLAFLSKVKPTSRWTGDGISYLSSLLNSFSTVRIENPVHSNQRLERANQETKGSAYAVSAKQSGPGGYRELEAVQLDDPRHNDQGQIRRYCGICPNGGSGDLNPRKIGRRASASLREEGTRRRAPSARQPHDIASGDKRGVAVLNVN
jgi:hypothetical protein